MESESLFSPCKFYSVWAANLNCALKQIQTARLNKCKMGRCCAQFQSVRQQFYRTEALSFYVVVFALFSPLCDILSLFYCAISVLPRTAAVACPIVPYQWSVVRLQGDLQRQMGRKSSVAEDTFDPASTSCFGL